MAERTARRSWEGPHASADRKALCRGLRQDATPAEEVFWQWVRGRRFRGLKWRRQHPIGPYVVDFYCMERDLAVELDGAVHEQTRERDADRDAYLQAHGVRVVRVTNDEFLAAPAECLARILS